MMPEATDNSGAENPVPYKLISAEGELRCQWLNARNKRFSEPFFEDTASSLRIIDPQNLQRPLVTSLQQMVQRAQSLDSVSPAVIIFHLSRCGSTLTTQLFASSERFIVLSEVPVFDDILCLPLSETMIGEESVGSLLTASLNLYGKKRYADEAYVILKTDCWHIFFHHILRKIFPAVPFVLMYRKPGEVFRSLSQLPGRQIIPELVDPRIFGLPGMPDLYQRDIYTATIIEKMLAKFLEVADADANTVLVNYNEKPMVIVDKIARFANIGLTNEELPAMAARAQYHSKRPGEFFNEETADQVPDCLAAAMRLYEMLEQKRKAT